MTHSLAEMANGELTVPQLDPHRFEPANRRRLSGPGLRTFLTIADLWGMNEEQRRLALGYPSRSTYHSWCRKAREHEPITLDVDTLTRISAVLGVHQALGILHDDIGQARAWLNSPHSATLFGGQPPIALVTSGTLDGLMLLRRFLDGACAGLYMAPNEIDANFQPYTDQEIMSEPTAVTSRARTR
jgi:hypothetical protein